MKNIRRIAAGVLAAAAVLTPVAAHADTPYAQASAEVDLDGSLIEGSHVTDVWHPYRGVYCVAVDESVDLTGSVAIHATPIGEYSAPRSLSVELNPSACGKQRLDTIAVYSQVGFRVRADSAFYLTVS
ncbi:hypothetical protein [Nonomuraea sp. JJY05]|jgi:hypothetical protein|uniref:hypothetical protein n=1 Tax=Nonomuraea sp. JJY05 TaxID=3350255 RepID=UPI00373F62EA